MGIQMDQDEIIQFVGLYPQFDWKIHFPSYKDDALFEFIDTFDFHQIKQLEGINEGNIITFLSNIALFLYRRIYSLAGDNEKREEINEALGDRMTPVYIIRRGDSQEIKDLGIRTKEIIEETGVDEIYSRRIMKVLSYFIES